MLPLSYENRTSRVQALSAGDGVLVQEAASPAEEIRELVRIDDKITATGANMNIKSRMGIPRADMLSPNTILSQRLAVRRQLNQYQQNLVTTENRFVDNWNC